MQKLASKEHRSLSAARSRRIGSALSSRDRAQGRTQGGDLSLEQLTSERIELEAIGTSNRRRGMRVHQHQITTTVLR